MEMEESDYCTDIYIYTDLSLMLSRVMQDIEVNEECILRKRKRALWAENLSSFQYQLRGESCNIYYMGSQSEGTTTQGLHSDIDMFGVFRDLVNVTQDNKDCVLGKINLLMIETEYPGYCRLMFLTDNDPLPGQTTVLNRKNCVESYEPGRGIHTLFKNTQLLVKSDFRIHGPALTTTNMYGDMDMVPGFRCNTWPKYFRQFSLSHKQRNWPTPEMIRYIETSGVFVVPTGHRLSDRPELEWRISTALAERSLMFSLNITQIRCYILLKMIVKTFIEPHVPDVISSYICKTLLFYCIERTDIDFWQEQNLLNCVCRALTYVCAALQSMNCPNYFNMSANLLLGKLDAVNQKKLINIIKTILNSKGGFLLTIRFDDVDKRLAKYITGTSYILSHDSNKTVDNSYFVYLLPFLLFEVLNFNDTATASKDNLRLLRLTIDYANQGSLQSELSAIVFPFYCSYKASLEACESILRGTNLTRTTLLLYKRSIHSDVTSSRLRYASYLYCTGHFQRTLTILEDVEQRLSGNVMQLCACVHGHLLYNAILNRTSVNRQRRRRLSMRDVALCVSFRQAELQCCPVELRFEMFRSTEEEKTNRTSLEAWMDKAAICPRPYIYFLRYMTYRNLGKRMHMYNAYLKLLLYPANNPKMCHRETAMNLLGQCLEHEMKYDLALKCYAASLKVLPRNNAAKWHISRLLCTLVNAKPEGCYLQ